MSCDHSRGESFANNVLWGLAGQTVVAAVNLVAIPRLVHGFGVETYGLYLLMQTAAGWVGALHFGAGTGLVRYAAESSAAGRRGVFDDALRHSAVLLIGGAVLGALVLWLAAPALAGRVFTVPGYYRTHGVWMIRAAALGAVFAAVTGWACAVFVGLHRFYWQSAAAVLQGIFIPFGVLGALALGRGLGAAAAGFVAVHALVAILCALSVRLLRRQALSEEARDEGKRLSFSTFARYSIGFWPGALAQIVSGQLDRAFVAGLRSMSEFTLYAVPAGVLSRLQTLPATAAVALLPVVGGLGGSDNAVTLTRLYLRASRTLFGLLIPAYVLLFCLMPQFLSLWLGGGFGDASVWPARLLVATQAVALLSFLPTAVEAGRRGGWWQVTAAWVQALTCLALWPWLIPHWGLLGAALGGFLAQILSTALFVSVVHGRLLSLTWERFARETLVPTLAGVLVLCVLVWPLRVSITGWGSFFALCVTAGALYTATFWRFLPKQDQDFLRGLFPS